MPDTKASADPSVAVANVADADSLLGLFTSAMGTNGRLTFANLKAYLLAGLAVFTDAAKGLVPASGGGTTKFLRADGTFAVPPDNDTTYSAFTSGAAGLVPASGGGTTKYLRADGTWQTPPDNDTTYSNFKASGASNASGLVPAPGATAGSTKFLREDATWAEPPAGGAGGPQNNFAATSAPTSSNDSSQGYVVGSVWLISATGEMWRARSVAVGAARWVKGDTADHPGYVPGRRYVPFGMGAPVTGATGVAGTTFLGAGVIKSRCTISELHIRFTTAGAAGNYQLAIYAHDAAKGGPTGTPQVISATGTTGAAGPFTLVLASNLQLEPGIYWFGYQMDQTTPVYLSQGSSSSNHLALFGSSAHPIGNGAAAQASGFSINGTYGTWPDLTSATLTEQSSRAPFLGFTVASVP